MFNLKKKRIAELEHWLRSIEEVAINAQVLGYSPKGSPAEHRFEVIEQCACIGLTGRAPVARQEK